MFCFGKQVCSELRRKNKLKKRKKKTGYAQSFVEKTSSVFLFVVFNAYVIYTPFFFLFLSLEQLKTMENKAETLEAVLKEAVDLVLKQSSLFFSFFSFFFGVRTVLFFFISSRWYCFWVGGKIGNLSLQESVPLEEVFQTLRCNSHGLTSEAAQERLVIFGHNKLEEKKVLVSDSASSSFIVFLIFLFSRSIFLERNSPSVLQRNFLPYYKYRA